MKIDVNVDVRHVTRIEGHGNIRVRVEGGRVVEARWEVVESPRFFEVMLKNRPYPSVAILASRICGICSISHALCSLTATESAFGIRVPEQARVLRLLAKHGELLQSHLLHLLFLALPDFFGEPGVVPLIDSRPEVVNLAVRVKHAANRICDGVAGRTTHPVTFQVGGMSAVPPRSFLLELKRELTDTVLRDLQAVADLFAACRIPDFVRETEFVSLEGRQTYPFTDGDLMSSDGVRAARKDYRAVTNEYTVPHSTSKWTRLSRESYAVGALARVNNNHRLLHPEAARLAGALGLEPVCHNPFMNHAAQLVECVHVAHEIIGLIDSLLAAEHWDVMAPEIRPRAGSGIGVVEAPRGILFHYYEYDGRGTLVRADCVVPTTQNNAAIHHDIRCLVDRFAARGVPDPDLERLCTMLVRAYDPCLSCSVH
ncbi:Ni/Fe hydrogenase subunit alpha [Desulfatiferula olefinivorans]